MPDALRIDVAGLRELRSELRKMDMQRDLTETNRRVVNQIIVPKAQELGRRTRINLAGRPTRLGSRGVASIRGLATQTSATVAGGGARVPYFGGHEFGNTGRYRQFPPKTKGGYIIYGAIQETREEFIEAYWEALDGMVEGAFPEGRLI